MPPKGKAAKPKAQESKALPSRASAATPPSASSNPATTPPATVHERSSQHFAETNPIEAARDKVGLGGLGPADRAAWITSVVARSPQLRGRLSTKAQRELWKNVNEASLPLRVLDKPSPQQWGRDRNGQDIGVYSVEKFEARAAKQAALSIKQADSLRFKAARNRAHRGVKDPKTNSPVVVTETEIAEERQRRLAMASLRNELYGETQGNYAKDPAWDDVVPIPAEEPEGALAAISYTAEYAEAISYLRAVMLSKEYSERCLDLTEHIISMNPAHYTVWLYRASIVFALKRPILTEIAWLNDIAIEFLKNYQIWHHRHLLVDNYYPQIADKPDEVAAFARSEREFLAKMFAEDTKNYHVWSYRSYLVGLLGMWDAEELASVEQMIVDDVRNNSAWSHRFFLAFSDPKHSTPGSAATDHDSKVPADIVDREIQFAQDKTYLAPQNQSPWNYLKGVLVKGGRKLATVEPFVLEFIQDVGKDTEVVRSTHALDLLAEIYAEKGENDKADICLQRLGEKWDRIRVGYWEWRRKCLHEAA